MTLNHCREVGVSVGVSSIPILSQVTQCNGRFCIVSYVHQYQSLFPSTIIVPFRIFFSVGPSPLASGADECSAEGCSTATDASPGVITCIMHVCVVACIHVCVVACVYMYILVFEPRPQSSVN